MFANNRTNLVNPVTAIFVSDASVQRVRRQHQNEVRRLPNANQKIFVKSANAKTLDVDIDAEAV